MSGLGLIGDALAEVVLQGDFTVPPYPAVAVRLQRLLASDCYSAADVADILATDAALATTILATANSAAHGSGVPITSLSRAVNRLGARTVGAIAVASGISSTAVASGLLLDVKYRVWRRTMTGALIAQKLASDRGLPVDEAFLSGVLHGFGRSIAVASIERLLASGAAFPALSVDEWMAISEQQRAPLARVIGQTWELPGVLAKAIEGDKRGISALCDLVLDADAFARALERGDSLEARSEAESRLLEELEVTLPSALETFMSSGTTSGKPASGGSPFVVKPGQALPGELRNAALVAIDAAAKRAPNLTGVRLAPGGIEVQSSMRYQECSIVRLSIQYGDRSLEPWFTVLLCVPDGQRHRVELQLFSPTREIREEWATLYADAKLEPPPLARAVGGESDW